MTYKQFELEWQKTIDEFLHITKYNVIRESYELYQYGDCKIRNFMNRVLNFDYGNCWPHCPFSGVDNSNGYCFYLYNELTSNLRKIHMIKLFYYYLKVERYVRAYECKNLYYRYESYFNRHTEEL